MCCVFLISGVHATSMQHTPALLAILVLVLAGCAGASGPAATGTTTNTTLPAQNATTAVTETASTTSNDADTTSETGTKAACDCNCENQTSISTTTACNDQVTATEPDTGTESGTETGATATTSTERTTTATTTTEETTTTTTTATTTTTTTTPTSTTAATTATPTTTTATPTTTTETTTTTTTTTPTSTTATQTTVPKSERTELTVEIVRVVDGDTMKIEYADGTQDTVRLLGVDTPEVHVKTDPAEFEGIPNTSAGREWLRGWGENASAYAKSQLVGEEVTITTDEEADRRGSFGRLLVYIQQDGTTFNRELIAQGYARLYESQFSERDAFANAEANAQTNNVGLWGFEAPDETTTTTTSTTTATDGGDASGLVVADVHANADGDEYDNLDDEYFVLENTGDSALDLGGYVVGFGTNDDQRYTIPDGTTLAPGETLTVRTGEGDRVEEGDFVIGSGSPILNNDGDTIVVFDASGDVVLEYPYGDKA